MPNCGAATCLTPVMTTSASFSRRWRTDSGGVGVGLARSPDASPDGPIQEPAECWCSTRVAYLSERAHSAAAALVSLRDEGLWPPIVPTPVLIEALRGDSGWDAPANRLLKTWTSSRISQRTGATLGPSTNKGGPGSAVDALVVAVAEPGGRC